MLKIVAEVGKNFIDRKGMSIPYYTAQAIALIKKAKESGADIVKFQTHVFEDEQKKRSKKRHAWIKYNEIVTPITFWEDIKKCCDELKIEFMTTPMSKMAAEKINHLVKRWKVGSADIVDIELLAYLRQTGKPIIISTGMSTQEQIKDAISFLGDQIECINYCISLYPCPIYKINLTDLMRLSGRFDIPVGFSDHSLSIEVPALAVRMSATMIEKHFTLNRNDFGPDQKVSLLPNEFKKMVDLCKLAEKDGESFKEEKLNWLNFRSNIIKN